MIDEKREAAVWKRVMDISAQAPACCKTPHQALTAEQVMELLCKERSDGCTYEALACRVRGETRQKLLTLARHERRHYERLAAVYYLMTGKKPCPERTQPPCIACTNEELRCRYLEEVQGAERYHALAEKAGSFANVFHELACEEEAHARQVLCILEQCL